MKVVNLIDEENRSWRVDMVKEIFIPKEASLILNLSSLTKQDKLMWMDSVIGEFSVRSTYLRLVWL